MWSTLHVNYSATRKEAASFAYNFCGIYILEAISVSMHNLLQIELEINGEVVDLHMKVDESGRGFFSKKRYSEVLLCSCSIFIPVVLCEK